jgi:putative transposase
MGIPRTSFHYAPKPETEHDKLIRKRLKELAQKRKRFGYRRLYIMLRREGFMVNHKRIQRLYKQEGLMLRRRRRKKFASVMRADVPRPKYHNHIWSMDFMQDNLVYNNRKLKVFPIIDEHSRKCYQIEADTSITGKRVCAALDRVSIEQNAMPEVIIIDNGPEFISRALDEWAYQRGIKLFFISPGKPVENCYIESFNGKLRDECLNMNWFMDLNHARRILEEWRIDYNTQRPHSSLDYLTPDEFLQKENEKTIAIAPKESASLVKLTMVQ